MGPDVGQDLYPDQGVLVEEEEIYGDLELPHSSGDFPYVVINMVSSVDGGASVSGKASGIGGLVDRESMRTLRSKVDAVMIGAGTLRAERLSLGLDDPALTQPLAIVLGGQGELPIEEHLITSNQKVLAVLPDGAVEQVGRSVEVLYAPRKPKTTPGGIAGLDLPWVLKHLRANYGVERLLVEGGPSLNRQLVSQNLVDELFLTVAPVLVAAGSPSILSPDPDFTRRDLILISAHMADGHLFLRYRLRATVYAISYSV